MLHDIFDFNIIDLIIYHLGTLNFLLRNFLQNFCLNISPQIHLIWMAWLDLKSSNIYSLHIWSLSVLFWFSLNQELLSRVSGQLSFSILYRVVDDWNKSQNYVVCNIDFWIKCIYDHLSHLCLVFLFLELWHFFPFYNDV